MRASHLAVLVAALFVSSSAILAAQRPFFRYNRDSRVIPGEVPRQRTGFTFCRLVYTPVRSESGGSGWDTDYPMADRNLMTRLPELTNVQVTRFDNGDPHHALVRPSDPVLFQCPFLYASDAGTMGLSGEDVLYLREYLLKGGFFWVDDFWGSRAWAHWVSQISRVLPEYDIVELTPDHPIFSSFYDVERVPQIPSIQHWRRSGGQTSERGFDSAEPHLYGILDERGEVLVLMTHNTDIADGWEREGEDWQFFHAFSPYGYAVGVNVALWALTH